MVQDEDDLVGRWLPFYEELASGRRAPTTTAQRHFVLVVHGHPVAKPSQEFAYLKGRSAHPAGPVPPPASSATNVPNELLGPSDNMRRQRIVGIITILGGLFW